jgi:hypothetical protein
MSRNRNSSICLEIDLKKQAGLARKRPKKQACLALRPAKKWTGPQAEIKKTVEPQIL